VTVEAEPLFADRYRLEESLGGGSAEVHRGTDSRLGRTVVVKIAPAGSADFDRARFENETLLLASLRHPGLVTLYDADTVGDRAYFVMQYVPGGSLAARITEGALPPEATRQIGLALAEALAYLHEHRVIHRDLKPGNVLLGEDGDVFVADFGIARTIDSARMTSADLIIGTPAYLAPEQARGGEITPACDLYSLGLILLECLTGRREYSGTPLEAAMARLHRSPVVPPDLPHPWPRLLTALTATQPEDRLTARQVAAILAEKPERTTPLVVLLGETAGGAGGGATAVAGGAVAGAGVVGGALAAGRALAGRPPVRRTIARRLLECRPAPAVAVAGGAAVVATAGVLLLTIDWRDARAPQIPAVPAVVPAVQPSHSGTPGTSDHPGPGGRSAPGRSGPAGAVPGRSGPASPGLSPGQGSGSASQSQPPAVTTVPPTTASTTATTTTAPTTTTPTTTNAPPPPTPTPPPTAGPTDTHIRTGATTG